MASSGISCFGFNLANLRDKQFVYFLRSFGYEQQSVEVDADTSISFWRKVSETDLEKRKPALLLIHGFATSALWQWSCQIKPLSKDFRVFVPDCIFFGKSFTKSSQRSEIFQAQMIAKAMEIMGVSTYSVAGTSYGGFVSFRMAYLFPERVKKVVIANSGFLMKPEDNKDLLRRANMELISELFLPRTPAALWTLMKLSFHRPPIFIPSFILNDVVQHFYTTNREERVELLDGILLSKENMEPLPTLTQKVLIIWGDNDGIFPLEHAYRIQNHLKENAELVIVKNTSHCVQLENPKEFNRLVKTFLIGETA